MWFVTTHFAEPVGFLDIFVKNHTTRLLSCLYVTTAYGFGMDFADCLPTVRFLGGSILDIRYLYKEFDMRALLSIAVLMSAAMPAFAAPVFNVPEPESLALIGIAAVAMLLVRRNKK